jgi:hypothetical protein
MEHGVRPRFAREATLTELVKLAVREGWQSGRQGTGYGKLALEERALPALAKLLLAQSLLEVGEPPEGYWDCYLLRYPVGTRVPPHVDPPLQEGLVHVRMNLLVAAADEGGSLLLAGDEVPLEPGDAVVFRPDRDVHEVTPVMRGERLVWSVGCNLPAGRYASGRREHGRGRRGCRCR